MVQAGSNLVRETTSAHGAAVNAAAVRSPQVLAFAASLALFIAAAAAPAAARTASSLVGVYDGRQMEMAAGLELMADGRFRYALSYGALDEEAAENGR